MQMHNIFKVNKLLVQIVLQLSHDSTTLLLMAGTCKLFMTAVLPVIWRELPLIVPLLKLLPNDAISLQIDDVEVWTVVGGQSIAMDFLHD
jgi:hypothetical protein